MRKFSFHEFNKVFGLNKYHYIAFILIHILSVDYNNCGIWAIQPFNMKNLFFISIFAPLLYYVNREIREGRGTGDSWIDYHVKGAIYIIVLIPYYVVVSYLCLKAVPNLFGYDDFVHVPTLWLGFNPNEYRSDKANSYIRQGLTEMEVNGQKIMVEEKIVVNGAKIKK